jgi:hypothetical protein
MDPDPRIGAVRLRTAAAFGDTEASPSRSRRGVPGTLFLGDRADHRPGLLLWFVDDAGLLRFVGGWENVAGHRYLDRWRPTRTVAIPLRAGRSVTIAGPRKPLTAIIDGYARSVPVRH